MDVFYRTQLFVFFLKKKRLREYDVNDVGLKDAENKFYSD